MARYYPILALSIFLTTVVSTACAQTFNGQGGMPVPPGAPAQTVGITISPCPVAGIGV